MLNKVINVVCTCLLLFTLVACKEPQEEVNETGVNESYVTIEKETTYTYKKSDLETDKAENVYVKADPNGNTQEVEVEVTLKSVEEGLIKDVNALENIINTSGDENYEIKGNEVIFENHGNDITYKGKTTKDLPIGVHVTYYLNGEEIKPSKLAHQSGHIKMVFEYTNHSEVTQNVQVPFLCLTMFMLDEEKFSNISVENGKVINLSDNKIVTLYGEPGLKESLKLYTVDTFDDVKLTDTATLEADVTDFTLEYTSTIVSNGIFKELEDKNINELNDSINDLSELNDKIDEIQDATAKLQDRGNALSEGVGKLNDSAEQLNDAAKSFDENISQIGTLTSGLNTLASELSNVITNENLVNVTTAIETTDTLLNVMISYCNTLIALKTEIEAINIEDLSELAEDNATRVAITNIKNSDLSNITLESLTELKTNMEALKKGLNSEEFIKGYDLLVNSSKQLATACKAIDSNDTKNKVISGASSLADASSTFKDVISSLNDSMPDLMNAINEFAGKINEAVDENRSDLNKYSGSNMKNIISNIRNLKKLDQDYDTFIGKLEGTTSSVTFTIETSEIK